MKRLKTLMSLIALLQVGASTSPLPGQIPANTSRPFRVEDEWYRAVWGSDIGAAGLTITDLAGQGETKIVAATYAYWYIASYDGQRYVKEWVSPYYSRRVSSLLVTASNDDNRADILVGLEEGFSGEPAQILVYDGTSRELRETLSFDVSTIAALAAADVDSDGDLEYLFSDGEALYICDASTGDVELRHPEPYYSYDLAIGNVDDDGALEIVTRYSVVDGQTLAVEWVYDVGFGNSVDLIDLNGDGRKEIIALRDGEALTVYDADLQAPVQELLHENFGFLRVVDVDADGWSEIVCIYDDIIMVWDTRASESLWTFESPSRDILSVAFGDTDGDGVDEVVWGAGTYATGDADYLYVYDLATQEQEWRSDDIRGPFYAMEHGDLDGDNEPELIYASYSSDSERNDGIYFVHDAATKELEYQSTPPTGHGWARLRRIRHANVDGDAASEVFVSNINGYLACYDGLTHAEQWQTTERGDFESLAAADVDGDGEVEIVAPLASRIYVFDAATGQSEWNSVKLSLVDFVTLRVAEIDGDGRLEMIVGAGALFAHDGVTHLQDLQTRDLGITALDTADVDGDGVEEIFIGTAEGLIARLSSVNGEIVETIYEGQEIESLAVADVTGDAITDYIFASENEVFIQDGRTSDILWQSGPIGWSVGEEDSLMVADIDEDGRMEIVVNIGSGIRVFEVAGFEATVDCAAGPTHLCLNAERFRVEIEWQDHSGRSGNGRAVPAPSDDSGLFWFFGANNWEVLIKVLDGCGINDNFWVFAAAITDVQYTLRVTDTATGEEREYFNPLGMSPPAVTDTAAFATCGVDIAGKAVPVRKGDTGALLLNQRFRVDVTWRDFAGNTGQARVVPFGTADSGLLWFFAPDNWEMLIKVLDGCAINGRFWVFSAATTNVEYTLRVTDTQTGQIKTYMNDLGESAAAVTDTAAFDGCP